MPITNYRKDRSRMNTARDNIDVRVLGGRRRTTPLVAAHVNSRTRRPAARQYTRPESPYERAIRARSRWS